MIYRALDVFLGPAMANVGLLFQYGEGKTAITRLRPNPAFWLDPAAPVFSLSSRVADPIERENFIRRYATQPFFNGEGSNLPPFFQNLLPEGPLRRHLEQLRGCARDDHFDILAMCGTDLPGAVYVRPAEMNRDQVADVVTQHNDALEMTVTPMPVAEATSLSGVQPKLSLVAEGGRYVARTKDSQGTHIIAKLPTVDYPLLPEVEALSLRLAREVGVDVCAAELAGLGQLAVEQPFVLGEGRKFLAVQRFDRTPTQHIHCEDFAQVLGIPPEAKYQHPLASYEAMATVMAHTPGMGSDAVLELLRRLMVFELLGNFDAHVKNFGVIYRDGVTPSLSPAYDVVAYAAYLGGRGHALRITHDGERQQRITPKVIRRFCNAVGTVPETLANKTLRETASRAYDAWPDMIAASELLPEQKRRLLEHFFACPAIEARRRRNR